MSFNEAIVGEWSEGYEYLGSIPRALRYNLDGYAPDAVTLSGDGTVIEYASPEEAAARIASELGIDGEVASRAFIADAGETISEPMQELLGIETEVETEAVRVNGTSILSLTLDYTRSCSLSQSRLAVCRGVPTTFIMAHGRGDRWKTPHGLQSMFALEVEIRPRSFDPVERELESEAVSEAPAADGLAPHPLAHRLLGGLAGAALGLVSGALLKALGGRIRRRIRRRVHASRPAVRQMVGGV